MYILKLPLINIQRKISTSVCIACIYTWLSVSLAAIIDSAYSKPCDLMSTCARWESSSIVLRIKGPYFILTFNSIYVKVLHEFYPTQQKWYCKWANGLPADDIPTILPSVSLPTIALPGVMQNCGQCLPSLLRYNNNSSEAAANYHAMAVFSCFRL